MTNSVICDVVTYVRGQMTNVDRSALIAWVWGFSNLLLLISFSHEATFFFPFFLWIYCGQSFEIYDRKKIADTKVYNIPHVLFLFEKNTQCVEIVPTLVFLMRLSLKGNYLFPGRIFQTKILFILKKISKNTISK